MYSYVVLLQVNDSTTDLRIPSSVDVGESFNVCFKADVLYDCVISIFVQNVFGVIYASFFGSSSSSVT